MKRPPKIDQLRAVDDTIGMIQHGVQRGYFEDAKFINVTVPWWMAPHVLTIEAALLSSECTEVRIHVTKRRRWYHRKPAA